MTTITRRRVLEATGSVGVVGIAGCLNSCESGDPQIEELAANPEQYIDDEDDPGMMVGGELTDLRRGRAFVDDGSGTAAITSGPGSQWNTRTVDEGICVWAGGSYEADAQDRFDVDLVLLDGSMFGQSD